MTKTRSSKTGRSGSRSGGKKSTRGRKPAAKATPAYELPGGFWRQILAILMLFVAVVLVFAWMGDGGELLNTTDNILNEWIGRARYLLPALLAWLAVKIFRSDNNRLPPVMWTASVLMIFWGAGIFGLSTVGQPHPNGGMVGAWLNSFMVQILNPEVAIVIYVILIFVTLLFILQTNPATVFKAIGNLFRTTEKVEVPEKVAKRAHEPKEKLKPAPKLSDLEVEINVNNSDEGLKKPEKVKEKGGFFAKLGKKKTTKDVTETETVDKKAEEMPEKATDRALVAMMDPSWKMPTTDLLEKKQSAADAGDVRQNAALIKSTLADFGIDVEMGDANKGPRVTQYTMRPPTGVNLSRILARYKEIALSLTQDDKKIRIEAPIPGTRLVGVEVPNVKAAIVRLYGVVDSAEWKKAMGDPLTFAVGKDLSGKAVVANLAKMPHLLIAGTTGSGKSVMTNTLISSLLYHNSPSDLKLIIVDPKQVEMAAYNDIPHLLTPIITSTEKAISAMKWAVNEMEKRYTIMAEERVKNIVDYNTKMAAKAKAEKTEAEKVVKTDEQKDKIVERTEEVEKKVEPVATEVQGEKMPYIVVVIDEMADLMMVAGKDLEMLIVRIAQKGRAAGIHLVLATQRPEAKVITGLIKANIPGKIAFAVNSQIDSRIMLDQGGAEKLLGMGDMLMLTTEMMGKPRRIQGAWTSDEDIAKLTDFMRAQRAPEYNKEVIAQAVQIKGVGPADGGAIGDLGRRYDPNDPVVRKAIEVTLRNGKFSTASLQTWLGKGHGFVSGLAIWLEEIGVIGPANGHKPREVLITTMEEFEELANNGKQP